MPIKDPSLYPTNWKEISRSIKERAGPETVMKLVRVVAALQRIERNRERLWVA